VRAGNAFEETVERLLQSIRLGVVGPGEQLPPERELATKLNVSRVTLREAIRALQEAGYVVSRRGRYGGTFVVELLPLPATVNAGPQPRGRAAAVELEDALTLRAVLEPGAAAVAASRELTTDERRHLRDRLGEASDADLANYRRRDSRLHLAIAEVTASSSLTAAVADVRIRLNELLDTIPLLERNIDHSNVQHEQVADAILSGDQEAARLAMEEHLDGTAALLRGFLS
jgi:DNA-binding FadR family transcriptional regulator